MASPFPAYRGEDPYIFVSYAHEDATLVYPELQRLKDQGFNVWYDEGISPGASWREELAESILNCDLFIILVSPRSANSDNCLKEVNYALEHERPVLAVHLEPTQLSPGLELALSDRQAIIKHGLNEKDYAAKLLSGVSLPLGRTEVASTAPAAAEARKSGPNLLGFGLVALAILVVGAIFLFRSQTQPSVGESLESPTSPAIDTSSGSPAQDADVAIAVLPFVNMSSDAEQEYFSDGMSEEILNSLVRTNTLPVIARTSSFQFKGKNLSVQKIASELNVTHVLEGSVRKVGNEVRITAQLVDARTGVHLWSQNYDRELTNIFALQDEIAAAIVKEIQARLGGVPLGREPSVRTRVVDEEAYDIYLKAKKQLQLDNPSSTEAIGLFQQAVELDPEFADAWVGLARAYMGTYKRSGATPKNVAPLAKSALNLALDLEPDNAAALSALGFIKAQIDYQWAEGSALMERAVRLSPQDAEIQMTYASYLSLTHQPGAMVEVEKAYRLDPFSQTSIRYMDALQAVGRQLDAERVMTSFLVTATEQPDLSATHIYLQARNLDLAEQHLERAKLVWGVDHPFVVVNDYRLAIAKGDDALASSIEQELLRRMENEYVTYTFWGSADSLKRRYELAYQQRQWHFVQSVLGDRPSQFSDEEWQDLRARMNIAELGDAALPTARSRTQREANALLAKRIELDPSVIDDYIGVYEATGFDTLEFSRVGSELWVENPRIAFKSRAIAVAENQFELSDFMGYRYTFALRGTDEYDLEATDGQIVRHYRRIDR